jgi:hypothetical protein
MAITNLSTAIERAAEVRHLASAIFAETFGLDWEDALRQADRQVDELLRYAEQWDANADPSALSTMVDTPVPQPESIYVPSAIEPHEQRAVDKALFERARGIRPQVVGRFAFVPSRTSGGTVYRTALDGSSCNCDAGEHGRLCWHRMIVVLESELAA